MITSFCINWLLSIFGGWFSERCMLLRIWRILRVSFGLIIFILWILSLIKVNSRLIPFFNFLCFWILIIIFIWLFYIVLLIFPLAIRFISTKSIIFIISVFVVILISVIWIFRISTIFSFRTVFFIVLVCWVFAHFIRIFILTLNLSLIRSMLFVVWWF